MGDERAKPKPSATKGAARAGCSCMGAAVFLALGAATVFVAFALGRAYERKPSDRQTITVDELRDALKDTGVEARRRAIEALGERGPEAEKAAKDLGELLGDKSEEVRKAAAEALEKIGPQAREAVPQLRKALEDGAEEVRDAARRALEKIEGKPPAPEQTPAPPAEKSPAAAAPSEKTAPAPPAKKPAEPVPGAEAKK